MERLDKIISASGVLSRKECKDYIRMRRIWVDGAPAKRADMKVDGSTSVIEVDRKRIAVKRRVVAILNKPSGYVTSTEDPRDRTVMELVPDEYKVMELFPVGRLDKDTEGLLLMTNDGELAHRLISPKSGIEKVYFAKYDGVLDEEDVEAFRKGIVLKDGTLCLPADIEQYGEGCLVTIREGKYHQVRRMMASRGMKVTYLERIMEGNLPLGPLERGGFRELDETEEKLLFSSRSKKENATRPE